MIQLTGKLIRKICEEVHDAVAPYPWGFGFPVNLMNLIKILRYTFYSGLKFD